MKKLHQYKANVTWTGNLGYGTETYKSYQRSYNINIDGKNTIEGSSDPAFLGDKSKHNPEELLLTSISSCHMLWYLHLCANEKIIVIEYNDIASATMEEQDNGSGKFIEVVLKPTVIINDISKIELAKTLHSKANAMCFIANSLNFEIKHFPNIKSIA